jgi:hypothetical protein
LKTGGRDVVADQKGDEVFFGTTAIISDTVGSCIKKFKPDCKRSEEDNEF